LPPIYIVLVILEDSHGRIFLQLRSQVPGIANPGKWGLFGGHLEPGESFVAAAIREVEEELSCTLQPGKMRFLTTFSREDNTGVVLQYQLFHYLVSNELDRAVLTEGERFAAFSPEQIRSGTLEGAEIVLHHLEQLLAYWSNRGVSLLQA
jgi:8-oxo-dGTP diphosphatase